MCHGCEQRCPFVDDLLNEIARLSGMPVGYVRLAHGLEGDGDE